MTDRPELSVVVIIYNREPYIRACLDSALALGCSKEIICVDDASEDGTTAILQEYAAQYPEIRLICHERNEGTNITRYDGLALCNGRYMTYLDADDELIAGALTELVHQAEAADVDVLEFGTEVVPCGEYLPERAQQLQKLLCPPARFLADEDFCRLCFVEERINTAQCGKLYARRLYLQALGAMERSRMGNLHPQAWYLSWNMYFFVRTGRTVEPIGFRYSAGRGQTHRDHESLAHIRGNCDVQPALASMRRVAEAAGRLAEQREVLERMASMCCQQSVITWARRLEPEELVEGWRLLVDAWGSQNVIHVLSVRYGRSPEKIHHQLEAVPWTFNGLSGAACIVYAGMDEAEMTGLWRQACQAGGLPVLLADESTEISCLEQQGAVLSGRLPEGEAQLRQRSWLLRLALSSGNVGRVWVTEAATLGDLLTARDLGCTIQSRNVQTFLENQLTSRKETHIIDV